MMVTIASVRLSSIRRPFHHNSDVLTWKYCCNYWLKYLIPIISTSIMLTIPIFHEEEHVSPKSEYINQVTNQSNIELSLPFSTPYVLVLNLWITWLMPMVYLIYITYQIKCELKKINERFNSLRNHQIDQRMVQENRITKTLVKIIIVFIALHAFRIIWFLSEIYLILIPNKRDSVIQSVYGVPIWHYVTASLGELFLVINSSVNVIIYLHSIFNELSEIVSRLLGWCKCIKENSSEATADMTGGNLIPLTDTTVHLGDNGPEMNPSISSIESDDRNKSTLL